MSALTELLNGTVETVVEAGHPPTPGEAAELADAAGHAGVALLGLAARLRAVANTECEPPDLDGLCMACGRKIAEPVPVAEHGCNPFDFLVWPVLRVRRLIIRNTRLARLMWAAACKRGQG